jgi:hypothetical protein
MLWTIGAGFLGAIAAALIVTAQNRGYFAFFKVLIFAATPLSENARNILFQFPLEILFASVIPKHVETVLFATATWLMKLKALEFPFSYIFDLILIYRLEYPRNFYWLFYCQAILALVPLAFLWLLPKRQDIRKTQAEITQNSSVAEDVQAVDNSIQRAHTL